MADTARPRPHCAVQPQRLPALPPELGPDRMRAIIRTRPKWVNGTVLHYHFFDEQSGEHAWVGPEAQREVVRDAFREWKDLGIGLDFEEVADRSEAEIRIGFLATDGSWSYVGRDVLGIGADQRTMNFGWDLTDDYGRTTALHEIGHTIGLPHEHQNPFAGIVWDEAQVHAYFGGEPNRWTRDQTFHNVLRKLSTAEVEGSSWDPDSVMEYWFPGGLIREPAAYRDGIEPPGTISPLDREWVVKWYPAPGPAPLPALTPFQSVPLTLKAGQQADFAVTPSASRRYRIGTFGTADTVLVVFEEVGGRLRYLRGDDDSGSDRNAHLSVKLFQGRRYVVRLRLYWAGASGQTAVMLW